MTMEERKTRYGEAVICIECKEWMEPVEKHYQIPDGNRLYEGVLYKCPKCGRKHLDVLLSIGNGEHLTENRINPEPKSYRGRFS